MASHGGELTPQSRPAVRVEGLHRSFNQAGGGLNGLDPRAQVKVRDRVKIVVD